MTRPIFKALGTSAPRAINMKDTKMEADASIVVSVMRPSLLGNPFKLGSYLSLSMLKSSLSTICSFPGDQSDEEWVKSRLPNAYGLLLKYRELGCPLGRSEAIQCYGEWLREAVRCNPSYRSTVLSLEGKVLGCCCKPKACHADEIIKVFTEIKRGLL